MTDLLEGLPEFFTAQKLLQVGLGIVFLAIGMLVAKLASRGAVRMAGDRLDAQRRMLLRRGVYYGLLLLVVVSVLDNIGVDLKVFLGAAGVLTVALGFASQTAASNVISGLFLLGEKPFVVGDVIEVGTTVGEVLSMGWTSARLRTFDNRLVRIPNEALLKSHIINLTKYPIRRVDLVLPIPLGTDFDTVEELLKAVLLKNPLVFNEPEPLFMWRGFTELGIDLQLSVWTLRENFLAVKTGVYRDAKKTLEDAGLRLGYPHRVMMPVAEVAERRVEPELPTT